jgi:hypothetical protein
MMQHARICGFICSIALLLTLQVQAQTVPVIDSARAITAKADSARRDTLSSKPKLSIWQRAKPSSATAGIDAVKALYNLADFSTQRLDGNAVLRYKSNLVLNCNAGFAFSNYKSSIINYNSSSIGLSIDACRNLFGKMGTSDNDIAFVGIGYGVAINRIGEVDYTIIDQWGTQQGTVDGQTKITHWMQLAAGFDVQLHKRLYAGWRVYGRAILNSGAMQDIAPLYIATYGQGDRVSTFGYSFVVSTPIW